jgi:hypothetical protein
MATQSGVKEISAAGCRFAVGHVVVRTTFRHICVPVGDFVTSRKPDIYRAIFIESTCHALHIFMA